MLHSFESITDDINNAYRKILENRAGKGENLDASDSSTWKILYGLGGDQALIKLKESLLWLYDAETSIG